MKIFRFKLHFHIYLITLLAFAITAEGSSKHPKDACYLTVERSFLHKYLKLLLFVTDVVFPMSKRYTETIPGTWP